jgi:molybdate transport system substrate-binding protein
MTITIYRRRARTISAVAFFQKECRMKRTFPICLFIAFCAHHGAAQITVAAAANMQFALEEIDSAFKAESGIDVKPIYGSSGKLTAQIKSGAPFDLFVSADMAYPDSLYKWKLAAKPPVPYAYGALVLWTCKRLDLSAGLRVLADSSVRKIALGDFLSTVYGPASAAALKKAGIYDAVQAKFVFGENIAQAAQYVASQAADVGMVAKSTVLATRMKGKGAWVEVPGDLYLPIAQGVVILNYGAERHPHIATRYYGYLFSPKVQEILRRYGYTLPKAAKSSF